MKIKVTEKDIKLGYRDRASSCPIALCLRRTFKTSQVFVYGSESYIHNERYTVVHGTRFVNAFDGGKKVNPTTFEVRKGR